MTNNLRKVKQDLCAFAKRCKDVHYTDSLLITFLTSGMLFSRNSLFSAPSDPIEAQKSDITNSIQSIRQQFRQARNENNKLLRATNLELTKLMEQGDHVTKSPWSSWQFGMNYFYNNWNGTYKGRGDKQEKYPYEGIFARSLDVYERTVSPKSKNYSLLSSSTNPYSASSNNRQGLAQGYGIASTLPISEPIVGFEVSAGINPAIFTAPTVTPLAATKPTLPQAINFKPVTPKITPPDSPNVNPPSITAPGTGNGDAQWIQSNGSVAPISQQNMKGGTLTVTANGNLFNVTASKIDMTGEVGDPPNGGTHTHKLVPNGVQDFNFINQSQYAVMKLIGGHEINIDDVTINYTGVGASNYQRWLFHTDGHNSEGESTWVLNKKSNKGTGTTVNMNGTNLVMYTSQYHSGTNQNANIGFVNDGIVSSTGSKNIAWIALNIGGNSARQQYFHNRAGNINLGGTGDILAMIQSPSVANGGWAFINDGTIELTGNTQYGVVVDNKYSYDAAEIMLNNPITISGSDSVGVIFKGWMKLEGGSPFSRSTANNIITSLPGTSRASIIKADLSGNKNVGVYFESGSGNTFKLNEYKINITGTKNTGFFVKQGTVNLGSGTDHAINITGGSENIGIFTNKAMTSAADITITADKSTGIFAKDAGASTSTGKISATGASVKALIADNSTITSSGPVDVTGTASNATDGAVGLAAMNSGTVTHTGGGTITVDGSASIGVFGENKGTVDITGGTIKTTGGAFNTYAKGGTINLNATKIDTGQKSLAFFTDNSGHINFKGATTANIAGGTDANTRGTAFYYKGNNYSQFTATKIGTWAATTFNNTLNKLTLNMASGSRLFIASDVEMNLSDTAGAGLPGALGATIVGTDYKTFMLYLSKLTLNQSINLDDSKDAYNQLEISNSKIDNDNNNAITGTQTGQTAIAQENLTNDRAKVTLTNRGTINLSGANSTGMYAKFGILDNKATGTITLGDSSTGLYGVDDSIIENFGTITMGSKSTGLYSEGSKTQNVINAGTITSTGTSSVGVLFKPDAALGGGVFLGNSGKISLGDNSVGLYGGSTAKNYITVNSGNITVGKNGIGMFGYTSDILGGTVTVGDKGIGLFSRGGDVNLKAGTITTGAAGAVAVYTVGSGQNITNTGTTFNLGDTSAAIVNTGNGNQINSTVPNVGLGSKNIYVYSNDMTGKVTNSTVLSATGDGNYGIYSAGTVTNTGNMNFENGIGNVGIYSIKGGTATNTATLTIGASNAATNAFGIGMAAGYQNSDKGNVINNGTIKVNGDFSIGMYASGAGSTATNTKNIVLNGNNTTGIYADNGAIAKNTGTIRTGLGSYSNVVGVYLGQGSKLDNQGVIDITSANGIGVYLKGGTIANYGTIKVNGSSKQEDTVYTFTTPPTGKTVGGASIDAPAAAQTATVTINGIKQTPVVVNTFAKNPIEVSASSIGMYVNTSGIDYTNAIKGLGNLTQEADLIIGTEATKMTNSKSIVIKDPKILDPYNNAIKTSGVSKWNIYSGGLNWLSTPTLNPNDGTMTSIYMVKIPYTAWAGKEPTPVNSTDTYNFLDGLDQRYGVEALGTRERQLFDKLNNIGNNEEVLFYQATDEMMGHQYGNLQQRINSTGNILDKEFRYLKNDWRNPSKQNNKIKVFGMRDEYNTDTAGIIDYRSNAYGVAYVHEDEKIKMGSSSGWYAGAVTNRFKFKDIGKSRENQTMLKAGIFKTMSPKGDHNGALRWTIGGDVFVGINDMKRRYLVVDEIFQAKSNYNSYGAAFKTDLGYDVRLGERTHFRPYGALKMEYGRFNSIKEDRGEMRLEVKGNDYFSVKPEVGVEFKYVQPLAVRTNLSVGLTAAYENELGKVGSVNNKGRVRYTNADWFGIRGEKEDRRGNGKFDLNIGIDNTRFGVTVNGGYDTKGNNVRAGLGFRAIY